MILVSLLRHSFRILNQATGLVEEFPACERPADVEVHSNDLECTGEYAVFEDAYGEIKNLPDPQPGVVYVVPLLVKSVAKAAGRKDVVSPSSGPTAVRFKEGPRKGQIDYVVSLSA